MGPGVGDSDNVESGVGNEDVASTTQPPHQQQAASVPDFLLRRSMVSHQLVIFFQYICLFDI